MKKARMNISHFYFILFNLKIFGEIVTTFFFCYRLLWALLYHETGSAFFTPASKLSLAVTFVACFLYF